jgi:hypothetical protein
LEQVASAGAPLREALQQPQQSLATCLPQYVHGGGKDPHLCCCSPSTPQLVLQQQM